MSDNAAVIRRLQAHLEAQQRAEESEKDHSDRLAGLAVSEIAANFLVEDCFTGLVDAAISMAVDALLSQHLGMLNMEGAAAA